MQPPFTAVVEGENGHNWLSTGPLDRIGLCGGSIFECVLSSDSCHCRTYVPNTQECVQHTQSLLERLNPVISRGAALEVDLTGWKTKLQDTSVVEWEHNNDPSWWRATDSVGALEDMIADANGLLDDISQTHLVDAHVHRMQDK